MLAPNEFLKSKRNPFKTHKTLYIVVKTYGTIENK